MASDGPVPHLRSHGPYRQTPAGCLLRPAAHDLVPAGVPPVVVRLEPRAPAVCQPVSVYLALMDDRYPSTDDHQSVRLDYLYPDAERDLNRWLPLVKWLLAISHYVVL